MKVALSLSLQRVVFAYVRAPATSAGEFLGAAPSAGTPDSRMHDMNATYGHACM